MCDARKTKVGIVVTVVREEDETRREEHEREKTPTAAE